MDQTTDPATPDEAAPESLFEQIGGAGAVAAVVDIFYARVLADPELTAYFAGKDVTRLKAHQRLFVGSALGATTPYTGRAMGRAHQELAITGPHFDRVVDHLAAALTDGGVDPATIGVIAAKLAPLKPDIVSG
ncbi:MULTISPECIES: group 1 truncated hemoglobin [unclassified Streptomyces]|uniref:group I truncated hemoglobin n=1 Tax=unclassified Streptomyces TaxID=2593676 RepID=UPI00225B9DBA|nr:MULTISPECIES: group 1 truncated hemoglobin [unclassified Streptomyces]MCX5139415.1 group 1 truncated hemoglobin [Streptomyces sp. NBC_00338]WRZ64092.1 group 1 truncated hemoglobin [Streptomyces sp. NBC_01257]WSU58055.1 group 1 truncated hemoglobin [Streptomyces sp. NBC_01104]